MAEIKTPPVPAQHVPDKTEFLYERIPGSFRVEPPDSFGERTFWYVCPCGCRSVGPLTVGDGFKPPDSPTWRWNGSYARPALDPSVWWKGHWHGWLKDGVWTSC